MGKTTYGPYEATVVEIHDGDTVRLNMDIGFGITVNLACRFYGINAPELVTDAGKEAVAFLRTLIAVGDKVTVLSFGWDKYGGRFDGRICKGNVVINEVMFTSGHARVMK